MARSFRSLAKWLVPGWLTKDDGGLVIEALMLIVDATAQRMLESLLMRFPSYCGPSALAFHGTSRGIPRGRSETNEHYAARLIQWRYPRGHRVRGGAPALLEQVGQYWGNIAQAQSIDRRGNRYTRATDGTVTAEHGLTWTWDALAASSWSRFWIILYGATQFSAHPAVGSEALYGGLWDPSSDYTIGQLGATPDDARAMRRLFTGRWMWRPAGTHAEWLVIDLTGGGITPDGNYGRWSKVVAEVRSAARDSDCRYWSLAPTRNNLDQSDPDEFTGAPLPGSEAYYEGDPDEFPLSAVTPAGLTFAGDPDNFATDVQLPDDGDHL